MNTPFLYLLACAGAFISSTALHAAPTAPGKTQQLSSPDQVPDGLAKSDWQSIRAAYEAGRHAFQPTASGWQALNPGQQWTTQFDRRGFIAQPKDGGWTWGLELQSYGFGEHQQAIQGTPTVKADGQRLSYQWDATVQEWFVNDQRGLEHGFTLSERPKSARSGELSFTMSTRGSLSARVNADAQGVSFQDESGATVLNYAGLKVWDADGKILRSRFESVGTKSFRLLVDESTARYPITIDPVAQQAYVKASNSGAGDNFGNSVALSGDTVIVGAIVEDSSTLGVNSTPDESAAQAGAAYVFVRSGTTWTQQAYLKPAAVGISQAGDRFGFSVAIAGDTVVVGARDEDSNTTGVNSSPNDSASDAGAAYVFVRSGTTWSQQAYLKASQVNALDNFGVSVAVAGNTVVVGATSEDSSTTGVQAGTGTPNETASAAGAAYVFVRSGTTWTQQAYLKPAAVGTTQAGDNFGRSVAVAGDTVVVGAISEDSSTTGVNGTANESASNAGAAYVFSRSGTTWTQQAYLKPAAVGTTQSGDQFGFSVALSADTLVVGAITEDSSTTGVNSTANDTLGANGDAGAAYVFVRSGTTWTQEAYLKPAAFGTTQAGDQFGYSVAIAGDKVAVGATFEDSSTLGVNSTPNESVVNAGAAYVFFRNGGIWGQWAYLKPAIGTTLAANENFGLSVAVSDDTVVVGATGEDSSTTGVNSTPNESAADAGAAYIFVSLLPPIVTSLDISRGSTAGGTQVTITGGNYTGTTSVTFGGVAASFTVLNDTTIEATTPAGSAGAASVVVTTEVGSNAANTLFTYVVPTAISGTRTVGPTGDYSSLTAALVDLQVQVRQITAPLVLELQPTYVSSVETFPLVIPAVNGASAMNTLTIRPQAGATGLSLSSAAAQTVDLRRASYVVMDGRPGGSGTAKQLTIANTSTSGVALRFLNEASNNTLRYLSLQGVNTSATSGTVLFGTTTGAGGNDNNTIDQCDIGDGASTPANGLYSLGTTTTGAQNNSGNTVTNCNVFNFYSGSVDAAGIRLDSGNTTWTLSGNSFYQTVNRAAVGANVCAIFINDSSGNSFTVTGNFIGGSAPNAGGTAWTTTGTAAAYLFQGIRLNVGATTPSSVQGNTIANTVWTSSSAATALPGAWSGIYAEGTGAVNIGTVTGNTIGSGTGTGSISITTSGTGGTCFGIGSASTGTVAIANNSIGSITVNGSSGSIAAHLTGIQVTAGTNTTISNNTVGSNTTANSLNAATAGGQQVTGIFSSGGFSTSISGNMVANLNNNSTSAGQILGIATSNGVNTITGNIVRNLSTTSQGVNFSVTQSVHGILQTSSQGGQTVSQNTVHSLANTATSFAVGVNGIYFTGGTAGTNLAERNLVHSLAVSSTSATSMVSGMMFGSVSNTRFTARNNMVRLGFDANGASTAGASRVQGIDEAGLNNTPGRDFYHNSVYIGGTQTSGAANTFAFIARSVTAARAYQNNIFVNARSNSGGTGKHYAVSYGGTTVNPTGLTADGNLFFVSGTGGVLGLYNSLDVATLAAWRTATGKDAASLNVNPLFNNPTGTATTGDLHLQTSTPAEAAGVAVAAVTDDFDGQTRSTLTPVDIGADARNFTLALPVAVADAFATPTNVSLTISAASLLANDTKADGATLSVISVQSPTGGASVSLSSGVVTFVPATGFTGTATFTYTILDSLGSQATGTATMTVNGTSAVVLDGGGIVATTPTTIDNPVTLSSTTTISGTQPVTINGPVTISGSPQVDVSASLTINGVISGTAELEKTGGGTLILTNANQHSGGTKVSGGTVVLGHNQALGTGLVKLNGGSLQVNNTNRTLANPVHLSASASISGTANLTLTGSLKLTGSPTLTTTNRLTVQGVVEDNTGPASLEKKGRGEMQLLAPNTFSGGFKATQGTVSIGNNSALGTGPVQLRGAAINALGTPKVVANPVQLTASTTFTGQKLTLSGPTQVQGPRTLTTKSDVEITGTISDAGGSKGSIDKKGAGKLTLSGDNTLKGGVTATQGTVAIGHDRAIGTGTLTLKGGIIESTGGPRALANPVVLEADTAIQGDKLSLTGKVTVNGPRTVTHESEVEMHGTVDAPTPAARGTTKLTKQGPGPLTLGPASKTQVPVTVKAGVIKQQGTATQSIEVVSKAASKDAGYYVNQVMVSGNPAMAYMDGKDGDLVYVRASDATGDEWNKPVSVVTAGDVGKYASLQVVDGFPAIAFTSLSEGVFSLKYVRATDALGTTWGPVISVSSTDTRQCCLRIVNGRPAVSYYNIKDHDLYFALAKNAEGSSWEAPVLVTSTGVVGQDNSLLVVDGNPAISYFDDSSGALKFVRATDPAGTTWGTPQMLDSSPRGAVGKATCMILVNGNPAISYHDAANLTLKYVRASNASGTAWGTPIHVVAPNPARPDYSRGLFNSLQIIDGNPALAYLYNSTSEKLAYIRATDANGTAWGTETVEDLNNSNRGGRYASMLEINGLPAIAHFDAEQKSVRYKGVGPVESKFPKSEHAVAKPKNSETFMQMIGKGGKLATGASPGAMSVTTDMVWEGGAFIEWEINDATGIAGLNWDLNNVGGNLVINATAEEPVLISIASLMKNDNPGDCANFNPHAARSWRVVNSGGITGFATDKFKVYAAAFSNDLSGGSFSIAQSGNNLDIVFTPGAVTNPDITVEQAGTVLAAGAGSVDFGGIAAAGSATRTFTIRNDGVDSLTDIQVVAPTLLVGGANVEVSITPPAANTLAPGASTSFSVTITNNDSSAVPVAASFVVTSSDPDESPFSILVSANGGAAAMPAAEIAVVQAAGTVNLTDGSPAPVSFGTVSTGGTASQSFTISNGGNADLTGLDFVVDGVNASDFRVSASPVSPVAASGTTTFSIEFTPSAGGTRNAAIHFASNDGDESPFDILLTGTGSAAPEIAVENSANASLSDGGVTAEEFGTVSVNSYEEITFTVRNEGTLDLTGLGVSIDGTDAGQFSISSALGTTTITPDGSASLTVRFAPTSSGAKSAALHITSNDADEPSFDILLAGEGVIAPEIVVEKAGGNLDTGDTVDVGVVATGSTTDHTFTVKNTGSADLTDLAVSVEGDDAADFTVTAGPAATLSGPSGSTTVTVRFAPSSIGPKSATLRIDSNDSDEAPFDIVLSSAGQPPEIAVEDAGAVNVADGGSKSFGGVVLGSSTSLTFTIRNTGLGDLTGLNVSVDGAHASDFSVTASPVAPVSGSGGSTTFTVEFSPTGTGTRTAAVHIENNDSDENPYDITVSGSGLAPEIALEQGGGNVPGGSTKSFGTVVLGSSNSLIFTVRNLGTSTLNNITAGISGTHAGDFSLTSSPAASVSVLGGTTTFTVQFTPSSLGSRGATLQILNNDPDENPIQINLAGTGMSSNPLEVWRFNNLGTTSNAGNTADLGDFDSDGVTNLAEFAFGTNPQAGGSGPPKLTYSGTFAGGGSITTTGQPEVAHESGPTGVDYRALFVRRKDHATAGLTYTVQFSATLGTWQTTTVAPTVLADDGVHQIVSVPYMTFIGGRKVKFFRVQVALTP